MNDWEIILHLADKNLAQENVWTSFIEGRRYKVDSVQENHIVINRLDGGEDSKLARPTAERAIQLLSSQGRIRHGALIKNVAKECALIQFHPNISWDRRTGDILWSLVLTNDEISIEEKIREAPDDKLEKIWAAVNQRQYSSLFRANLLQLYDNRCVVSGICRNEVLQAAHIEKHSKDGINDSTNGLLLRADLHILFDRNLLQIHPTNLTIHFSPTITDIEYTQYSGRKIIDRVDKKNPNEDFLKEKWNSVDWTAFF